MSAEPEPEPESMDQGNVTNDDDAQGEPEPEDDELAKFKDPVTFFLAINKVPESKNPFLVTTMAGRYKDKNASEGATAGT